MDPEVPVETGHVLEWNNITFVAPKGEKIILSDQLGRLRSGRMLAVMGPSGAGKSTFLDVISKRSASSNKDSSVIFDGVSDFDMRTVASYIEQDDALLGVLTVQETVEYAARLSLPHDTPSQVIRTLVNTTLESLGLMDVSNNRIGTPIQRGISGGQKRRVTVAASVVSRPRILLCDEPTSGLDSTTSYQVVSSIKQLAQATDTIVIATIHQPNWETLALFDDVLFLSGGHCMYYGPVVGIVPYFTELGYPCPPHTNPGDHVISIINADFNSSTSPPHLRISDKPGPVESAHDRLSRLAEAWRTRNSYGSRNDGYDITVHRNSRNAAIDNNPTTRLVPSNSSLAGLPHLTSDPSAIWAARDRHRFRDEANRIRLLMQRATLNYQRNLLAYGIRIAMYAGMGILLATIWVKLGTADTKINDRLSVHFFSVAFLGFMSVAGIPSFLEERAVFVRERNNGLYGPGAYAIANSIVTIPFLFICALLFAVICYWAIGLHPGASAFFRFLSFLFIAVYIAEAQSILVAAILPIFVAALAVACFLNGFWMCVQGYFIRAVNLPRFWYYWAHFIDYQTFAFNLLVRNDLTGLTFQCTKLADGTCHCSVPSSLVASGQCALKGEDVLRDLQINGFSVGLYAAILLIIAVLYRVLFYMALVFRKR